MNRFLTAAAVCLVLAGLADTAHAQVQWFPQNPGKGYPWPSFVHANASAQGDTATGPSCTYASSRPAVRPERYEKCGQPLTLEPDKALRFDAADRATARSTTKKPSTEGSLEVIALQDTVFGAGSLKSSVTVETKATGPAKVGNHGKAGSSGQAYLRVPEGAGVRFSFTATMTLSGNVKPSHGGFEFQWVPNTISANRPRTAFADVSMKAGTFTRDGLLAPGVYWVQWGISNGVSNQASKVGLDIEFTFGSGCAGDPTDTDGDGLPDEWELIGVKVASGRCVPVHLLFPSSHRPDPKVRDVYVELDYMKDFKPEKDFDRPVREAFASTGAKGGPKRSPIRLHVIVDEEIERVRCIHSGRGGVDSHALCNGRVIQLAELKRNFFGPKAQRGVAPPAPLVQADVDEARDKVYHYAVAGDLALDGYGLTTGFALDKDFAISLRRRESQSEWRLDCAPAESAPVAASDASSAAAIEGGKEDEDPVELHNARGQAVFLMHELGHTLALFHGGADHIHYKPNYLSVMNYAYANLARRAPDSVCQKTKRRLNFPIDYSHHRLPPLDECRLDENHGITGAGADLKIALNGRSTAWLFMTPRGEKILVTADADGPIDWDQDRKVEPSVPLQLRGNALVCDQPLQGHDDWAKVEVALRCRYKFPDEAEAKLRNAECASLR